LHPSGIDEKSPDAHNFHAPSFNGLDISRFKAIISNYNLDPQWKKFQNQFLEAPE